MIKIIIQSLTAALLLVAPNSYAGTDSGGGGGVLLFKNQAILVDLLIADPNFHESHSYEYQGKIYQTDIVNDIKASAASELAIAQMEYWEQGITGGSYARMSSAALRGSIVQWDFIDHDIVASADAYYLPLSLEEKRPYLKLAGYYRRQQTSRHKNKYMVEINRTLWSKMQIRSQAALIIHESIRHLQIGSSLSGRFYFPEKALVQATSIIAGCEYNMTLDAALGRILDGRPAYSFDESSFQKLMNTYCKKM